MLPWVRRLCWLIAALQVVVSGTALATFRPGRQFAITSRYGEPVEIFGAGIYARDSLLRATIFTGVDLVMLLLVPVLLWSVRAAASSVRAQLGVLALLGVWAYYALSLSIGVTYNWLFLAYTALLGATAFATVGQWATLDRVELASSCDWRLGDAAVTVFLILGTLSVSVAWLPDIVGSWLNGGVLSSVEVYTTEITYALDLGLLAPLMITALVQVRRRTPLGLVMYAWLVVTCLVVALQVTAGTFFQLAVGIDFPLAVMVTKIGIFVVMGALALWLLTRLHRSLARAA